MTMNVGDVGGSWHEVPVRKGPKKDGGEGNKLGKRNISKFFITNLPPGCNPWDVADFVRVFGEVAGVYIARKADKEGRKFGFVSFFNVVDVKDMERVLNGTKMGGYKLQVNLARFAKENQGLVGNLKSVGGAVGKGKNVQVSSQIHMGQQFDIPHQNTSGGNNVVSGAGKGKLFSDLFKEDVRQACNVSSHASDIGPVIEIADETVRFGELIGSAVVGKCKNLTILRKIDSFLADAGVTGVSLSYLGGLSVLIKFVDEEYCAKFLLDHQLWKDWFSNLDQWNCQSLPFERLAWVRIQGVPMHLADNDVLNNIAEHFGKVVHGSQMEVEDRNLSVSWIGLLVGDGKRIHGFVTLKWKNMQFRVWVEEEFSNWVPDYVSSVDVSEESGSDGSSPEVEAEPVRIFTDGDTTGLGSRKNTERVGDVHVSKSACPPQFSGGSQRFSHEEGIGINDIYFFKSPVDGGPKKRRSRVRPRIKNKGVIDNKSPVSDIRPRKRMRDEGVFSFDLNKQTEDSQHSQHSEFCNFDR
ncbi:putative RNA recognition motif domain, nucleotide-binding alpha-beta plait domain superfamily [Helianthus annuus]|uniref:Putative nucleotide-binding alpha-beta plait domain-containing protein n=1 Tax=Helianthus annuus TaxID=4232 RepID=A0A251SL24_HELAN|nr:putative RNA recognition motif domain, nucleotide-binding alpha-beta plait domain superfamily [Helianthus annuus]KAJ0464682.1 putative RNA recognition motif domain, nucleotide-binding alpha-beta plait domain superfamily [Helianthus annuus]KAJ0469324.1 putative RNA recognition motif domain, nucleotide-binding alpha-beta plait domain superfamily [Helianthus annuus]KAJ0486279.1 putative RNA recognition motif domain, nucleotide-binding alpha-beta plait domain superfamily [Helianthus annuus]KAJ06